MAAKLERKEGSEGAEQGKAIPVTVEENVRGGIWIVGSIPEDKWIREIKFTWIRGYGLTANSDLDRPDKHS